MSFSEDQYVYGLPLTLGHEGAGTVAALGRGGEGGQCGRMGPRLRPVGLRALLSVLAWRKKYWENAAAEGIRPPGLGAPDAIAEYLLVDDARHLVALGDLDPVASVPHTDAGMTPYYAIKKSLLLLVPGSVAVVIEVGGLGHVAVQILRLITPSLLIALDTAEDKVELARTVGAHFGFITGGGDDAMSAVKEEIRVLSGERGATVVFDFVGLQATTDLAAWAPRESSARASYWGSRSELMEVLELARSGRINVEVERFSLEEAPRAYERLQAGTIRERAVIVPAYNQDSKGPS